MNEKELKGKFIRHMQCMATVSEHRHDGKTQIWVSLLPPPGYDPTDPFLLYIVNKPKDVARIREFIDKGEQLKQQRIA